MIVKNVNRFYWYPNAITEAEVDVNGHGDIVWIYILNDDPETFSCYGKKIDRVYDVEIYEIDTKNIFSGAEILDIKKKMTNQITKSQAEEFYRDLCGTVYGDTRKTCQGVMSVELIADHMKISMERSKEFCDAMIRNGITERQGGGIVV